MTPSARSGRSRTGSVLLAVLAVLAVAVTAYAVSTSSTSARAGQSAVVVPTPDPEPVTSLWFGDSIVEGCCRSNAATLTMAQTAARRLGWAAPAVVGAGGTGYVTSRTRSGVRVGPYPERITEAVDGAYYDVVVVAGGNNDDSADFDPVAFRAAVRTVLGQVRTSLPDAQLVVLGPYSPDGTGYAVQRQIELEEAERLGAIWVDQVAEGWMRDRPTLLASDGFHPNDAGQVELGVRAAEALRRTLPATVLAASPAPTPAPTSTPASAPASTTAAPAGASTLVLPEDSPASTSAQALTELERKRSPWR